MWESNLKLGVNSYYDKRNMYQEYTDVITNEIVADESHI